MQPSLTADKGSLPPRFRVGDLEVDVGKAEVTRGDEKIALPKLSFDMLCALINAAPAIVTNDELLSQVWPGLQVSPESVSQCVKRLRSAIGDDSQQPRYILGVRGRGYRLIPVPERLTESRPPTTSDAVNLSIDTPSLTMADGPTSQFPKLKRSKHWRALLILGIAAVTGLVGLAIRAVVVRTHGLPSSTTNVPVTVAPSLAGATPIPVSKYSIAVLPFVDMSEKKDQEYFADGLSEELIDMLTQVPELRVPARTSSFYFKGKQTTIADIAKVLGVAYVLEGSVRKSGNTLRITAQLIRVDNGYHMWSTSFDRQLGDIFQIQDDISNAVVSALKVSLGGSASISSDETSNATAYDLFLRADSAYRLSNKSEDYQRIVEELQEAIRIDPSFARAWALLSRTLSTMAGYSFTEPTQGFEDARHAALKALELNPNEIAGHLALAKILYLHDWNWERANGETQKALAIKPNDPANLGMAGVLASILGHADEALQYAKMASDIDPLNFGNLDILGEYFMNAGYFKEAQEAFRRAQSLNPSYLSAHWSLGEALLLDGKTAEALAEFEREGDDDFRVAGRALAYYALGRTADALEALRHLESLVEQSRHDFFFVAQIYAFRGERDQAFAWLTRAYEQRETTCGSVKLDPLLKSLRSDPRYKAFLKKMNLPE